jgi:hypothetical protein
MGKLKENEQKTKRTRACYLDWIKLKELFVRKRIFCILLKISYKPLITFSVPFSHSPKQCLYLNPFS